MTPEAHRYNAARAREKQKERRDLRTAGSPRQGGAAQAAKGSREAAYDEAYAAAAITERARLCAILTSDEAKGRQNQARYIAFNTNMSAEEGKQMLAAAVRSGDANSMAERGMTFDQAMGRTEQPRVGVDAGSNGGGDQGNADSADDVLAIVRGMGLNGFGASA